MLANHNPRKGSLMDTTVEKAVAEYLANLKQEEKSDETVYRPAPPASLFSMVKTAR
jgi:hypothetical protein